jgi:zinc protease
MTALALGLERRVLGNGMTLLACRTTVAPTLAVAASFEITQEHEPPELAGIGSLIGETLDEGTERWTGQELAELVEGVGGSLRTSGGGAAVQVAAEDAKLAVDILEQVVRRPTFPATGVRRAKDLTIADIKADLDDPRTVASQHFRAMVYGSHPYGRPAKGSIESVRRITPAALRRFHGRWFRPSNCIAVAVGDVEPQAILDLLEHKLHGWRGATEEPPGQPMPAPPARAVARHVVYERAQVQVYLGHLGITRADPDFYALLVMDHILGSGPGFTSRITKKLRDEQGLCYAVGAGITSSAGKKPGLFSAYIGTSPGQEQTAIDGFLREMHAIRAEPPTAGELADVKAYLTGSFVWALERNANLAGFLLRAERFALGDDYAERFPRLIEAVDAETVREAAARHLDPEHYYLVTLGPKR